MTPREALHLLETLRDVQLQLAKPGSTPGSRAELSRLLAADRAQALTIAIDSVNATRRAQARRSPKELSL